MSFNANRDLRLYLGASLLENLCAQMLSVAVGWQIYAESRRPLDLGLVGLVQLVPSLGLALPAGHLADRFDRARVVALSNLVMAACATALFAIASTGGAHLAAVYAALFFVSAARAFGGPAGQALLPDLVSFEDLQRAVTLSGAAWQLATIAGPALGGLIAGAAGPRWVYAGSAALLGLGAALACAIRAPGASTSAEGHGEGERAAWSTVLAGFRYIRTNRVILESISLDLFAVLLGGATALLPVYASDVLHVGATGLGLLQGAPAAGAAGMALVLSYRPIERRAGPILLGCVGVFGVATMVFAVSSRLWLSLAALVVLGAADMVSVVARSTVVQLRTPPAMRGRVSAVSMMFIGGSSELGALESGLTAALLGAVPAVLLGGAGTLAVVAAFALFSKLRAVDRLDGPAKESPAGDAAPRPRSSS